MKIAMIEDDETIAFAVSQYLQTQQIETTIYPSLAAVEDVSIEKYELMILDVHLPDGSGFDYLRYLRSFTDMPVIFLTVQNHEKDILKGFAWGVNEYITKPFSLPILKARIDNVLRRKYRNQSILVFKMLQLDSKNKAAKIGEDSLYLNKQEFSILEMFLENPGVLILRERIIDIVWRDDFSEIEDNTLTVTIKRLRQKLGTYGKYIKTIRGMGYLWDVQYDKDE